MDNLENDAEEEIMKIINELEIFFQPITDSLEQIINPVLKSEEEEL